MFRILSVVMLLTGLVVAAIGPVKAVSPSPAPPRPRPQTQPSVEPAPTPAPTPTQEENKQAVRDVLRAQQIAWNHGDIKTFMDGYWHSRDTVFVSGSAVTRGWQTVFDRYKAKHPSRDKMGELTFSDVEVRMFGYDGATAFGRWQLNRENDSPHGWFTLILRNMPEGWKIVHDHTSQSADAD